MAEPENLILVHLRELRSEVAALRDQLDTVEARLDRMEQRLEKSDYRLDRMEQRLDAMHLNGVKALRGFIGHRAMTERAMGSMDTQIGRLEQRVARLEAAET